MALRIQFLNGGLANQTFQYIFYRWLEMECPNDAVFLDDTYFQINTVHNGYELERVFNVHPHSIRECFDDEAWAAYIEQKKEGKSVAQAYKDSGLDIKLISEVDDYSEFTKFDGQVLRTKEANTYYPELATLPGCWYYHGYWICKEFFYKYKDIFLKELQFPPIEDEKNKEYLKMIKSSDSCGLHIRRGDFVNLGWSVEPDFYKTTLQRVLSRKPNIHLFVFSDDIKWCKEHESELGLKLPKKVTYVEGNTGLNSFRDAQLMSLCKGLFITNSSFDYMAALLNKDIEYSIELTDKRTL